MGVGVKERGRKAREAFKAAAMGNIFYFLFERKCQRIIKKKKEGGG